jgi:hypothetical protein
MGEFSPKFQRHFFIVLQNNRANCISATTEKKGWTFILDLDMAPLAGATTSCW